MSNEALKRCIGPYTEMVARVLRLSRNLVYRWQEPRGGTFSGKRNPIDVIHKIIDTAIQAGRPRADALAPVHFLARKFDHVLIEVPGGGSLGEQTGSVLRAAQAMGDWLTVHSRALEGGSIEPQELELIRNKGYEAICQMMACIRRAGRCVKE
jgi:hypothetical protein